MVMDSSGLGEFRLLHLQAGEKESTMHRRELNPNLNPSTTLAVIYESVVGSRCSTGAYILHINPRVDAGNTESVRRDIPENSTWDKFFWKNKRGEMSVSEHPSCICIDGESTTSSNLQG
jgi:hypothetical protein